jgi:hypothetical protein
MPLGVNHLDGLEHVNRLHRWLPALGTFGTQSAGFECRIWLAPNADCAYSPKAGFATKLLFGPA